MLFIFQDLLSSLLLPLLTLVIIAILSKWYFFPSKILKNLPPSPTKLPIIGNLHQLGSSPHRSLQALAKKHGPLMLLHFGRVPVVVVSSADASREIMKTHDLFFANRAKSSVPSILSYNARDIAFADYGEYWRQIKSIAVLRLLSQNRVQSFRRMREEETDLLAERIKDISCSPSSPVVNLSELLILLTNGVICRAALGRKHEDKKFKELFVHFVELLGVFSVGDYIPWLSWVDRLNGYDARAVKIAAEFDEFIEGVIEEHVDKNKQTYGSDKNDEDKDFVDILLEIQNEKDANFALERDTVKALILDVFTGGTDSTYATLEWELSYYETHTH